MISNIQLQDSARWAENLTQEHLHTVIWLVGEFRLRCAGIIQILQLLNSEESRRALEQLTILRHVPPLNYAVSVNIALPMISDQLKQLFPCEKHARWAVNLSNSDLLTILVTIGRLEKEADSLFELWCKNKISPPVASRYPLFRASFAFKILVEMTRGQRYNVMEYCDLLMYKEHSLKRWLSYKSSTNDFDLTIVSDFDLTIEE